MFKPLELFVGLRYLRARRSNRFVSFISLISFAGIALGVAALIVVISVMNGFGNELRGRLVSLSSHITITGADGRLADWPAIRQLALDVPGVVAAAPVVSGQAMLVNGTHLSGAQIDGVLPALENGVTTLADNMVSGSADSLVAGSQQIVLGAHLAFKLGVSQGDRMNVLVPRGARNGGGIKPVLRRVTVAGVFEAGTPDHDSQRAFLHLTDAAALYDLDGDVSGVRIRVEDMLRAPIIAYNIETTLATAGIVDHQVGNWTLEQKNYFRAIKIEKVMMFTILLLIVAVAAFNIVATLVMVVNDKRTDIAILRTLGMSRGSVMSVFIVQGLLIGLIGTSLGALAGVLLTLHVDTIVPLIERVMGRQIMPADVYYFTEIPADLRWPEVLGISLIAFFLATVATIYPARRAAATLPAEALRYE